MHLKDPSVTTFRDSVLDFDSDGLWFRNQTRKVIVDCYRQEREQIDEG